MSTTLLLASALIPTFFLLWYLCSRDANPEPPGVVIRTFLLGALVTLPIVPVAWGLEALGHNAMGVWPKALVGGFLGAAIPEELFKFLVLRGWVWRQKDFDEPMDGIVYMMACGTGFAVWVNYHRLSAQGHQVYLSTGAANAVVTTLDHASFAGALGYVMGRAKFSRRAAPIRALLLMLGLLGAAALNGQFTIVESWVIQSGMAQHPWRGVGFAAVCAAAVFGVIWLGSQRLLAASPFRRGDP